MIILRVLFIVLLVISLAVEITLIQFPFVFLVSILFFLLFPDFLTVAAVFIASLMIDSFRIQLFGITPTLLFLFIFLLNYRSWFYSIKDIRIILFFACVLVLGYAVLVAYSINFFLYAGVFGLMAAGVLILNKRIL